jgi:hypothetical protein
MLDHHHLTFILDPFHAFALLSLQSIFLFRSYTQENDDIFILIVDPWSCFACHS